MPLSNVPFKMDLVWSTASDKCEKKLQDYINECEPSMRVTKDPSMRAGKKNLVIKRGSTKKTSKSKKKSAKKTKRKKMLNCKAWRIFSFLLL